jgi:hypothetical protein
MDVGDADVARGEAVPATATVSNTAAAVRTDRRSLANLVTR